MKKRKLVRPQKAQAASRSKIDLAGSPLWRITLPAIAVLFAMSYLPRISRNPTLSKSFLGAVGVLVVWLAILVWLTVRKGRVLTADFVPRRQHYVQACVQASIFLYWGWYWRTVYDSALLIIAQLVFAYAFDSLLCWSRRNKWTLGFGPFPIILSINIFLWFKDDWFYLQFIMIAVGFLAKEFITWKREGKRTHIFNPSAFSLGLFSFVLVFTHNSDLTWGNSIAGTLFMPPKIYVFLFLLGLIAMVFFSTTLIAASAAITLLALSAAYFSVTGVYWFVDANIPIAVFLGLHLLVTDPATSPRSLPGKAIFGIGYGVLVFITSGILASYDSPRFYDKLLPIPILNLSVRAIDRFAESKFFQRGFGQGWSLRLNPSTLNLAFMSVWIVFFITMNGMGVVGDSHPGRRIPFWQSACDKGLVNACKNLVSIEGLNCQSESGWACNELGIHLAEGKIVSRDRQRGARFLSLACRYGSVQGCANSALIMTGGASAGIQRDEPQLKDYPILLQEGKAALPPMSRQEILKRACDQGWVKTCTESLSLQTAE